MRHIILQHCWPLVRTQPIPGTGYRKQLIDEQHVPDKDYYAAIDDITAIIVIGIVKIAAKIRLADPSYQGSRGFMEYDRCWGVGWNKGTNQKNFDEFPLPFQKKTKGSRRAAVHGCGVPVRQSGMTVAEWLPAHNLVPEWNDLLFIRKLSARHITVCTKTNNFRFTSVYVRLCVVGMYPWTLGRSVSVRDNEHGIDEGAYKEGYAEITYSKGSYRKGSCCIIGSRFLPDWQQQISWTREDMRLRYMREWPCRQTSDVWYSNMKLNRSLTDKINGLWKERAWSLSMRCNVGVDVKSAELLKESMTVILCCGAKACAWYQGSRSCMQKESTFAVDYLSRNTKSLLSSF